MAGSHRGVNGGGRVGAEKRGLRCAPQQLGAAFDVVPFFFDSFAIICHCTIVRRANVLLIPPQGSISDEA